MRSVGCPRACSVGWSRTLVAESIAAEERAAHEAEEKARAAEDDDACEWATREWPPERIDDVTADEFGEQR
jgi:hypothetical protein